MTLCGKKPAYMMDSAFSFSLRADQFDDDNSMLREIGTNYA